MIITIIKIRVVLPTTLDSILTIENFKHLGNSITTL